MLDLWLGAQKEETEQNIKVSVNMNYDLFDEALFNVAKFDMFLFKAHILNPNSASRFHSRYLF